MSIETPFVSAADRKVVSSRAGAELFLISLLLLFLEMACIRWFPAHVLFLTFFTNTILLASFLGMSLGCLTARWPQNFLLYTPALLAVSMASAHVVALWRRALETVVRVGNPASPQLVFFGTEYSTQDPTRFFIPIEAVEGFFFLLLALTMVGPGQELGRLLNRLPNRVQAYSLNILGSIAGVLLFAACAWWELSPFWWFLPIGLGFGYFLLFPGSLRPRVVRWDMLACLGGVPLLASLTSGSYYQNGRLVAERLWSPYYRIDYYVHDKDIHVNLLGHQRMVSRQETFTPAYALPHILQRDVGGRPFEDVLIIGVGSGNDVSRALAWGARHIDAVEIDPAILRLGVAGHPDSPYQDPRVTVIIDDGRNFLRSSRQQYDLIVYALVDSLVLHSSYSNIRLESFMFTREAFADVRSRLKPGGLFVMYNFYRQGWIVARLHQGLKETFQVEPVVLTLPFTEVVQPETTGGFTLLISGATERLREAFQRKPAYWLPLGQAPTPHSPNGFEMHPGPEEQSHWMRFGMASVVYPENLRAASDDWPFLYLRRPMIPDLSLRGMAIMGGLALGLFWLFLRRNRDGDRRWSLNGRMFFLGAGFMLLETKAVVHMALLFGGTWMVNTVVFLGVFVMILAANLFVWRMRPVSLAPYYSGLMATLALNSLIPLDSFLGINRSWQVTGSCLLAFTPILFTGIIFAVAFDRSAQPDRDFGANVAGAVLGGLAEYGSMLLGFQYLSLVVMALYALSAVLGRTIPR